MVSGRWKVVLTQTAFPCPVRSDQRNRGKETSGSDFRCSNGSRCPARLLFSRYLCSVEILLVVWDSRSGSWWVEWLRWGGLGEGFVVRVTGDLVTCRKTYQCHTKWWLFSLLFPWLFIHQKFLITLALSDLNQDAFWFMGIGSLFLLQRLFVLAQSLFIEFYHHRTYWTRCKQKYIGSLGLHSNWCVLFIIFSFLKSS